ncbi:MAG: hypothetical protein Q7S96_00230 [bacterium]|nr:hypothetical protein [bacterium]
MQNGVEQTRLQEVVSDRGFQFSDVRHELQHCGYGLMSLRGLEVVQPCLVLCCCQ